MKNSITVKKETLLKISAAYLALFLTMVCFFIFFNDLIETHLIRGIVLLFLIFLIFTGTNLLISLRSVKKTEFLFKEKEQIFEKISNMSGQGIFLTSSRGIIKDMNIK